MPPCTWMFIWALRTAGAKASCAAMAATRSNSSTESADARAASHTAAVASSAATSRSAQWCFTAWKVPMVRPNCTRSLAYATAASVQAAMTPTASAAPSVRANERARGTAPASTSLSRTPTDDTVTRAERRDGSRSFVPREREAVGTTRERDEVLAGPQQHQVRPGAAEDDPTVAVEHPVGQGQRAPQSRARPPRSRRRDRGGSRHAARRCRTARSRRRRAPWGGTAPGPPGARARRARRRARSGRHRRLRAPRAGGCRASPDRPSPASKEGRTSASASSRARLAASEPWAVSTPRTVAPSSWCSSVMAIGIPAPFCMLAARTGPAPPGRTTLLNAAPPPQVQER